MGSLIRTWSNDIIFYRIFLIIVAVAILLSIYFQHYFAFLLPAFILGMVIIIEDYRRLFYLIFLLLPFSVEVYFEGPGLGTDLPSEPAMLILSFITVVLLIRNNLSFPKFYITHPIFILIGIHVFWIFITALNSSYPFISFKLLAAKIWYILPFFILPLMFVQESSELEKSYRILYKFLFVSICYVIIRHAFHGFSFASTYEVVQPFYRNHVSYAAICVVCLPFVWAFYRINKLEGKTNILMTIVFIVFIAGIYFSFTRAAILSMFIAWGAWYIIKKRWVKPTLFICFIVAIMMSLYLSVDNKYMDLAPDFEKTITHSEFDNLLEATYKLEDISSMERIYRWISGIEMLKDRFWLGFGPGSFYSNYKLYSISSFQTYVSNNPDQSGIHNYFLMTWVEQGFIGFLILIALCFWLIIEGERVYHATANHRDKYLIMATLLGLIIILSMCLINDLIETDKVGPFFFFNAAIILFYGRKVALSDYTAHKVSK